MYSFFIQPNTPTVNEIIVVTVCSNALVRITLLLYLKYI